MHAYNQFDQPIGEALPDWQPRPLPRRGTHEGHFCRLEPLNLTHAAALFSAYQLEPTPQSWTWLAREPDTCVDDFAAWVESISNFTDPMHFAIIDKQINAPVGAFALMRIDQNNGVIEVGHVHFSPLLTRTIMATEAHWLLMHYVFETMGYRRYEWKCDSLNVPSHRAALRLGFQYEGRFRQALVTKGRNRDTDWFSIIDKEWPIINAALRHWLAANNFDAHGKQLQSLENWRKQLTERSPERMIVCSKPPGFSI